MLALSAELARESAVAPTPLMSLTPRRAPETERATNTARPNIAYAPEWQPRSSGRYDARMVRAARIARQRAEPHSTWYCWRYVKDALLEAGVVDSRPASTYARQAGRELCERYGFVRLRVRDPWDAPVGAVVVYDAGEAGHVELRTDSGFASDFVSRRPYSRRVIGIFVKPS